MGQLPQQNLASQVNVESRWRQVNFWKPIILEIVTIGLAAASGYIFSRYLGNSIAIIWLLIVLGAYAAVSALHILFTKTAERRFTVLVLEMLALLIFFYRSDVRFLAAAAVAFVVLCEWGYLAGKDHVDNGLNIKFLRSTVPFLKKFTSAIIIVFILVYISQWNQNTGFVSQGNFQVFFDWAAGFAGNFYPEISLNSSFGALTESVARLQLGGSTDFTSLPTSQQDALVSATADKISSAFSDSIGRQVSPDEPTVNVVYEYATKKVQNLKDQSKSWFLVLWALVVFLAVRGLGFFFYWIAGLLSFIFYQILLASGFVHVIGESRTHEVVLY